MRKLKMIFVAGIFFLFLLFPIFSSAGIINLPQTGQATCYDTSGAVISCASPEGKGQDGAIRAGVEWPNPRFVDNGNGTITDRLTGLMWLQDMEGADCFHPPYNGNSWSQAFITLSDFNTNPGNYNCKNYTASFNDWRLPNVLELESLPNDELPESITWLTNQGFNMNIQTQWNYWSSTNYGTSWWQICMGT